MYNVVNSALPWKVLWKLTKSWKTWTCERGLVNVDSETSRFSMKRRAYEKANYG